MLPMLKRKDSYCGVRPNLVRDVDWVFENIFDLAPQRSRSAFSAGVPKWDISEDKKSYVVEAELPGFVKEDIKLNYQDGTLTISGARAEEKRSDDKTYHRLERASGSFERSVSLPESIVVDDIKAQFLNGVLTVTLPKSKEASTEHSITIA